MGKYTYTKQNVFNELWKKEKEYNRKWVKACNDKDVESMKKYSDMKTAIQNLIIDFEEQFE